MHAVNVFPRVSVVSIGFALATGCVLLHGDPAPSSSSGGAGGQGGAGGEGAGAGGVGGDPAAAFIAALPTSVICAAADMQSPCVQAVAVGRAGPVATRGDGVRFVAGDTVFDGEGDVVATAPPGFEISGPDLHGDLFAGALCISGGSLSHVILCEGSSCVEAGPESPGRWGGCAWNGFMPPVAYAVREIATGVELVALNDSEETIPTDGPKKPAQLIRGTASGFTWSHDDPDASIDRWPGEGTVDSTPIQALSHVTGMSERDDGGLYLRGRYGSVDTGARVIIRYDGKSVQPVTTVQDGDDFARVVQTKENVFADGVLSGAEQLWKCTNALECQAQDDPLAELPEPYVRANVIAGLTADQVVYYTVEVEGPTTLTVLVRYIP